MLAEVDVSDLTDGQTRPVKVGGRDLLVIRWDGEVYALRNICPHMSFPMTGGRVAARTTAEEVGEMAQADDQPVLECPYHNFPYDLRTGVCIADPTMRVRAYKVLVRGHQAFVEVPRR